MKNKTGKRILVGVVVAAVGCSTIWGILAAIRSSQQKPVNVYAVSDFAMTDYWGDTSETQGMVTTDKLQKVMISKTQKVNEVLVQEGQTVSKGDVLLKYDTTLSDLEVKKAEIEVQQSKLQLTMAEKELKSLKAMTPHSSTLITPSDSFTPNIQEVPYLIQGSGSEESPYYYLWDETHYIDELYSEILPDGTDDCYLVLVKREENALNGKIEKSWGFHLLKNNSGISVQVYEPDIPENIQKYEAPEEPYYVDNGSEYTASELKQMRDEKAQEISDLQISIKLAELQLQKKQKEMQDGSVVCTVDGTVTAVRNPEEAYKNSEPVVEVSGGGGYYINGTMSELELGVTKVGQTVQVNSWKTGTTCEGTITEIYTYPVTDGDAHSEGNTNVSYYPFRVFVDESAMLQENEYVNIQYQRASQEEHSLYLENQFIRTENGQSYIYIRDDNEKLEKRVVRTGKDLYGSYTEIKSGLTADDFVAFPYGKNVFDGAKTKEATMDEFYGY